MNHDGLPRCLLWYIIDTVPNNRDSIYLFTEPYKYIIIVTNIYIYSLLCVYLTDDSPDRAF